MFKTFKWAAIAASSLALMAVLVLGRDVPSFFRTSAKSVGEAVRSSVPIDFELQRARDMVDQIIPELEASIQVIAEEEVEVELLQTDIVQGERNLQANEKQLAMLKQDLKTKFASYTASGDHASRAELTRRLADSLHRCQHAKTLLETKHRLLTTRQNSLAAAHQVFEKSRSHKSEIEQQIESLEAQYRLVKAQSIGTNVSIDNSHLAQADKLISQIKKRLDVAERVLEHQLALNPASPTLSAEALDEEELLVRVDSYLSGSTEPVAEFASAMKPESAQDQ